MDLKKRSSHKNKKYNIAFLNPDPPGPTESDASISNRPRPAEKIPVRYLCDCEWRMAEFTNTDKLSLCQKDRSHLVPREEIKEEKRKKNAKKTEVDDVRSLS